MFKKVIALSLLALAAGCQTAAQQIEAQTPPTADVRRQIVEGAKKIAYDPYSIRDAEISNMVPYHKPGEFVVCVKANAKNLYGAYTGQQGTLIGFTKYKAVSALANHPMCRMESIRYHPFPELEAL